MTTTCMTVHQLVSLARAAEANLDDGASRAVWGDAAKAIGASEDVSSARIDSLAIAADLGVDVETFAALTRATRLARGATIVLPSHRYENLSRGRGWARKGKGASATWGERDTGGYRVGPGRWSVGATDGFRRKDSVEWVVEHIKVGNETWTIAD